MDANTRRLEMNLVTLGTGVALLGLWTFIRISLMLFVFNDEINAIIDPQYKVATYILIFAVLTFICICQCYVGLTARGQGKGKHKTPLYLILAGIGVTLDIILTGTDIISIFTGSDHGIVRILTSVVIEATSIGCTLVMMISGIRLRKIRKGGAA